MRVDWTEDEDDVFDPRATLIGLDANALERNGRRDGAVDRFLDLAADGRLRAWIGEGVRAEMARAGQASPVTIATRPSLRSLSAAQQIARIRVRAIVEGNARAGKHQADAIHVSEAAEAGCAYFITHDSRILRKRDDLEAIAVPQMKIVALEEFLAAFDRSADC